MNTPEQTPMQQAVNHQHAQLQQVELLKAIYGEVRHMRKMYEKQIYFKYITYVVLGIIFIWSTWASINFFKGLLPSIQSIGKASQQIESINGSTGGINDILKQLQQFK